MKIVNVKAISKGFGRVPTPKTLPQIVNEVEASKGALNPYTIIGQKIISHLIRNFIFPFLQPQVVNPLEFCNEQEFYLQRDDLESKFSTARIRDAMGMDEPVGLKLCLDPHDVPFFVRYDELSTRIATIDYRVSDFESFRRFIPKLVSDKSFLIPMERQKLEDQYDPDRRYKKGDVVLVPGQKYGKIGLVVNNSCPRILARFYSEEKFHTQTIGIDSYMLRVIEGHKGSDDEESSTMDKPKIGKPLIPGALPEIGNSYFLSGYSNYKGHDSIIGKVEILGYDVECATVVPHTLGEEKFPWGNIRELNVPVSELVYLGSIKDIKRGVDIYSRFFANDIRFMQCIQDITEKEIDNPFVSGLIAFSDLTRYQRLYQDLLECPEVPKELVAPQFIHILTSNGIDGIERLAKISDKDVLSISSELFAADLKDARREIEMGLKKYGSLVERLQKITRDTTEFNTIEELLQFAGPQINLYQMPRDGSYTLAYINSFETLVSAGNEPKAAEPRDRVRELSDMERAALEREGIDPDSYERGLHEIFKDTKHGNERSKYSHVEPRAEAKFLRVEDLPKESAKSKDGGRRELLGVYYKLLCKENEVRYGRDENFSMTYPGLQPIDSNFKLYPLADDFQLDFFSKILLLIDEKVEFEGKSDFIKRSKNAIKRVIQSKEDSEDKWERHERHAYSSLLSAIQPLYNGIKQITQNPEIKDKIALHLLGETPLLLEAFYDFENLQKMITIRDHYWRGRIPEKMEYLGQFGYWRRLSDPGFADEFYTALSNVDMYHRGFPDIEEGVWSVSRSRSSGFRSLETEDSKLGLCPSQQANELLAGIQNQVLRLSDGIKRADTAGLLKSGQE